MSSRTINAMVIEVKLFAMLRERAGSVSVQVDLPDGATVAEAIEALGPIVGDVPVVAALNREYVKLDTPIAVDDELALVPPVSGGGHPDVEVAINSDPLDAAALSQTVGRAEAGAIVIFQGVTREVEHLDYEVYEAMARQRTRSIAEEVLAASGACAIAIAHRSGRVPLGEPSVVVAASGPHRQQAFEAARQCIDRVKVEAPIWKREPEGWVEGAAPDLPQPLSQPESRFR